MLKIRMLIVFALVNLKEKFWYESTKNVYYRQILNLQKMLKIRFLQVKSEKPKQ